MMRKLLKNKIVCGFVPILVLAVLGSDCVVIQIGGDGDEG